VSIIKSVPNLISYLHEFFQNCSQFLAIYFELYSSGVIFNSENADEWVPPVIRRALHRARLTVPPDSRSPRLASCAVVPTATVRSRRRPVRAVAAVSEAADANVHARRHLCRVMPRRRPRAAPAEAELGRPPRSCGPRTHCAHEPRQRREHWLRPAWPRVVRLRGRGPHTHCARGPRATVQLGRAQIRLSGTQIDFFLFSEYIQILANLKNCLGFI
jgi:hypothetical protein